MQAVFYGIGSAVIGIIAISSYKLSKKSLGKDWLLWLIYLVSMACTMVTESEIIWLFLGSGLIVWAIRTRPKRQVLAIALPLGMTLPAASTNILWQIALFFAKAGSFVFGSGLAIVPFLYGGVVKEHGWLNDQQFLDAVAVAMITPGPVVITVGFIGFLIAGFAGASVAADAWGAAAFLAPGRLAPAAMPRPFTGAAGAAGAVEVVASAGASAVVASAVGAAAFLAPVPAAPGLFAALLQKGGSMLVTLAILCSKRKIPEPFIILGAAIIGLVAFPLLH